ncbi:MAG TPA: class I SAM-dependent methyltransferase [Gemmatimonadales bacterium]|nr:class I SAM-dependent methyltransferase [Gemmatimonadales bacterium]
MPESHDSGSRDLLEHWNRLYRTGSTARLSWYEPRARRSLQLIQETCLPSDAPILDVGGGASVLVDDLLRLGYTDVTVLDLAPEALARSRERLGSAADRVRWIAADVRSFVPPRRYALWHDRAVLHFLVNRRDRERYAGVLRTALLPRGHVVVATFGPEGPTRCSGLPVRRYSAEEVATVIGEGFELVDAMVEDHHTPEGAAQQFLYTRWQAFE